MYRALRNRLSVAPASLFVAFVFALIHTQYPVAVLPELAFGGFVLCLIYEYSGSLLPGIALFAYADLGGFEEALRGTRPLLTTALATLLLLVLGLAAIVKTLSARRGARDSRRAHAAPLRRDDEPGATA